MNQTRPLPPLQNLIAADTFRRTCTQHPGAAVSKTVSPHNTKGNAGRRYYSCPEGCFLGWGDMIGVHPNNPTCHCGMPSRRCEGWFECANEGRNCGFRFKEEQDDSNSSDNSNSPDAYGSDSPDDRFKEDPYYDDMDMDAKEEYDEVYVKPEWW
jgi:hypothetical protein